ncbi:MAG: hypothetical protein MZU97_19430 [Bacillus subtilis]|nr:hypothetical protein [Bacillus subtilis]
MSRILVCGSRQSIVSGMCPPPYRSPDSNPGSVMFSLGGVATNIAVNFDPSRTAIPCLICVLGTGLFSRCRRPANSSRSA